MNQRIKDIRKNMKLSQGEFAERISISRSGLTKIESGENNPSEQTIVLICEKFGINRKWLETGEGERLASSQSDSLIPRLQKVLANYPALANALGAAINVMQEEDFARLNQIIEEATKKEQP